MTKRYTVISVPTKDGPTYRIYDRINQCSIEGGFDTEKWAESVAEMMEDKWRHERNLQELRQVQAYLQGRYLPEDRQED